ncbi:MAG: luciferase domain-containing protein [Mucilaginibacter sp.]
MSRYLGFLKAVPGLGMAFDGWLKIWALATNPQLLDWMDEIEAEVLTWPHTTCGMHKYGGLQFNCRGREIGHIHSNGLLDMLLNQHIKALLIGEGRIADHHSFKNSGWISFYMHTDADKAYAIKLLRLGHERIMANTGCKRSPWPVRPLITGAAPSDPVQP